MGTYKARIRTPGDVGLALQQARLSKEKTQKQVAELLGVTQSAVSELEAGKPTIHIMRIMEYAREIGLEIYATWEDEPKDESENDQ